MLIPQCTLWYIWLIIIKDLTHNKRFITRLILVGGSTALHSMPCLFCMLAIFLKPVLCGHFSILLKLVSAIFFQIFIFHWIIALQKLWKMFFILSKKLFSFLRYLNFCIFVFSSFFRCQPLLQRLIQEKS